MCLGQHSPGPERPRDRCPAVGRVSTSHGRAVDNFAMADPPVALGLVVGGVRLSVSEVNGRCSISRTAALLVLGQS
jgi:hypothetical protein